MSRNRLGTAILLAILLCVALMAKRLPADSGRKCVAADDQLLVPGGLVRMGTLQGYPDEGPPYEVTIKPFWIDRHEVTNRQYAEFVAATGYRTAAEMAGRSIVFQPPGRDQPAGSPSDWWRYVEGADWRHPEGPASELTGRAEMPVVHIAYADALAYARWRGRSLPTEEQFEHAARAEAAESIEQPAPQQANTWQGEFPRANSRADGHAALAPVGCYEANAFGLNDMIGNAWEWTSSWYLPTHGPLAEPVGAPGNPSFDPLQPDARARVIKGGSFLCAPNYCARYRPEARHAQDEVAGASHLGFRTVLPVGSQLVSN